MCLKKIIIQIDTHMSNKIIAVLGPTNTGKTFLAIEKMLNLTLEFLAFL